MSLSLVPKPQYGTAPFPRSSLPSSFSSSIPSGPMNHPLPPKPPTPSLKTEDVSLPSGEGRTNQVTSETPRTGPSSRESPGHANDSYKDDDNQ
ncbi:hypothetical protein EYZ11_001343 [Aspergillus tanneri]|uniref:Uncharacterized protein n=1 Tax=Aspergillus tanneri TaxID=1220188 RepID=A0A4S3JUT5_9EURO|nr:hypothetical protein EYZ11_001343 [Aspergillus tanneri]